MDPIKKLDALLDYIRNNGNKSKGAIITDLRLRLNVEYGVVELDMALQKLIADGYVYKDGDGYFITFDGYIFKGYAVTSRKNLIDSRGVYIQTLILTCGTVAAGVYGLFEIARWLFHHEHWKIPF